MNIRAGLANTTDKLTKLQKNLNSVKKKLEAFDARSLSQEIQNQLATLQLDQDTYLQSNEVTAAIHGNEALQAFLSSNNNLFIQSRSIQTAIDKVSTDATLLSLQLDELAKEKELLATIKKQLSGLVAKIDSEKLSLDEIVNRNQNMTQEAADSLVKTLPQEMGEFVLLHKKTVSGWMGNYNQYALGLTPKGEALARLERPEHINPLEAAHRTAAQQQAFAVPRQEEMSQLQHNVDLVEEKFQQIKNSIIDEITKKISERKKSVDEINKIIEEANDHMTKTKNVVIAEPIPSSSESQEDLELLQKEISEIENQIEERKPSRELFSSHTVLAKGKLETAARNLEEQQRQNPGLPVWAELSEKMKRANDALGKLTQRDQEQDKIMQALKDHKAHLEQRVRERVLQAEQKAEQDAQLAAMEKEEKTAVEKSVEKIEQTEETKKADKIRQVAEKMDGEVVKRYQGATTQYMQDLAADMKMRLTALQENNPELFSALSALHNNSKTVDLLSNELRNLYDVKNDNEPEYISKRASTEKLLEHQKPVKGALNKYHLMTKLDDALTDSQKNNTEKKGIFHRLLKEEKNQKILFQHRDRGLWAFFRGCGKTVMNILHLNFEKVIYHGVLFQSGGKRYDREINKITEDSKRQAKRLRL